MLPVIALLGAAQVIAAVDAAPAERFLGADGVLVRDQRGHGGVVQLRGVNLGAWLKWEGWMSPIDRGDKLPDRNPGHNGYEFDVRALLTSRFGAATAHDLITTYKDHWVTARDLDLIKERGLNVVRVPFCHDHLIDERGGWRSDAFRHLDWVIDEAAKRGMWTILDYHGYLPPAAHADGSASGYWSAEEMKRETIRIWAAIAARYRGNPAVALYDLINEPNNSAPKGTKEPSATAVTDLYDRLYHAIRAVDPDHLIAMEGVWDWRTLRDPGAAGYANVVYSLHWYHWNVKTTQEGDAGVARDVAGIREMWTRWRVPVYVGEFNHFGDQDVWRAALAAYDQAGFSWTMWSWKNKASGSNSWGLLTTRPGAAPAIPDLATDSAESIRAAWRSWATDDAHFALNPMLAAVVGPPPAAPPASAR